MDATLAELKTWIETESPTSEPASVNAMMGIAADAFRALGAGITRYEGRNGAGDHLSVTMPWGDGKGILILCHLDTVHPLGTLETLPFKVDGDKVYGPGSCDMKSGVFMALTALREIVASGQTPPLPVRLLLTADEETGSATSRGLIETAADDAHFALVTEAGRDGGKVVTGRRGVGRYGISVQGRAAHAGVRHAEGRSAIAEMARQVLAIEAMTDYEAGLTLNVGRIHGGTVDNTVPEFCHARIDARVATPELARMIDAKLRAITPIGKDVSVTVTGEINRPPYRREGPIDTLYRYAESVANDLGQPLGDTATGGGSDGSLIANKIPVLDGLGPEGSGAHTLHEHFFYSTFAPRVALFRRLIETLKPSILT
ncbi:MAG: M20 family metallopeptidase [Pseudomonadota bacterium]